MTCTVHEVYYQCAYNYHYPVSNTLCMFDVERGAGRVEGVDGTSTTTSRLKDECIHRLMRQMNTECSIRFDPRI